MNWNEIKLHPSQLGKIWVEPQSKAAREMGELSATTKTYLTELYAQFKYGRKQELDNKYINKGKSCEESSLLLLSEVLNEYFEKNEETFESDYLIGTPDCFSDDGETVIDVKTSYSIFSFLSNLDGKLDTSYELQLQAYMLLTGKNKAKLAYCLVDNPISEIEAQKQYLIRKLEVISEEDSLFKKEWQKKRLLYEFNDIPETERVLIFDVEKDPDFELKLISKAVKCREYLDFLDFKHKNFNNGYKQM